MENKTKKAKWTKKFKALIISLSLAFAVALGGACAAIGLTVGNNKRFGGSLADGVTDNTPAIPDPAEIFYAGATVGEVTYATNAEAWAAAINYSIENSAVVQFDLKTNWTATADANGFGTQVADEGTSGDSATYTNSPFGAAGSLSVPAGASVILNISKNVTLNRNLASVDAIENGNVITNNGTLYVTGDGTITGGNILKVGTDNATGRGGGICSTASSVLYIYSGNISNNKAENGAGVDVSFAEAHIYGGTFSNNTANYGGGGIFFSESTITMNGGEILYNTALVDGGGLEFVGYNSDFVINNVLIKGNTARNGGGLMTVNCTLTINGGTITKNIGTNLGAGIRAYSNATINLTDVTLTDNEFTGTSNGGGAAYVDTNSSALNFTNCTITGNSSKATAGAIFVASACSCTINDSNVSNNTATGYGGAIYANGASGLNINDSTISDNTVTGLGGGIAASGNSESNIAKINIHNSILSNNKATGEGGAIMTSTWSDLVIGTKDDPDDVTEISGNTGTYGAGVRCTGIEAYYTKFINNEGKTLGNGGGLRVIGYRDAAANQTTIIDHCTFMGNSAIYSGGGASFETYPMGYPNTTVIPYLKCIVNETIFSDNTAGSYGGGVSTGLGYGIGSIDFEINGNTISNNTATNGGGVQIGAGVSLTMTSGTISGNTAVRGGGVYSLGTFEMNGGEIIDNRAVADYSSKSTDGNYGGHIGGVLATNFTMTGGKISGNTADGNVGGLKIDTNGVAEIDGGEISNNTAKGYGKMNGEAGGIYVESGASLTMSNITISGNSANGNGGGVFGKGKSLTIISGTISDNHAAGNGSSGNSQARGGGIWVETGTLVIGSATDSTKIVNINNNRAEWAGGGLYAYSANVTSVEIYNAKFNNNVAVNDAGGAYCQSGGTNSATTIQNCSMTSNTAGSYGGGIYIDSGSLTVSGSTLSGNTALNGGGIFNRGPLNLRNIKITDNTALNNGGGVYYSSGAITFNDEIIIKNNAASDFTNNFFRTNNDQACIAKTLSASSEIWISTSVTTPVIQVPSQARLSCVKVDNPDYWARTDVSKTTPAGSYDVKLTARTDLGTNATRWAAAVSGSSTGNPKLFELTENWDASGSLCVFGSGTGFYSGALHVPAGKEVILDLKNYSIDRGLDSSSSIDPGMVIYVEGKLTIKGSGHIGGGYTNLAAHGATSGNGGGIYVDGGELILNGGYISNNIVTNDGGGVYVDSGSFTMNGGVIENNTAENGGGVYVNSGSFTMNGGVIGGSTANKNTSSKNGGGVYNRGTFIMNGGTISANTGDCGAGVYNLGTFTMNGGTISNNVAVNAGGAIYSGAGSFEMTGGVISGNQAVNAGAGLYINAGSIKMSGGTVSGNYFSGTTATNYGGGVAIQVRVTFNFSGGRIINNGFSGDTVSAKQGGGIFLYVGATLNMSGTAEVSGNKSQNGGGIQGTSNSGNTTLNISGGKISGNTATDGGGGIQVYAENNCKVALNVSGGEISGNNAAQGGGVFVNSNSTFEMTGGKISGNQTTGTDTTKNFGGGVFVSASATFTMSGTAVISGNTSVAHGGGIYSYGDVDIQGGEISGNTGFTGGICATKTLNISGGKISGNKATKNGGGVAFSDGTFTMSDGEIFDNTAPIGGGVYVHSGTFKMTGGSIYSNEATLMADSATTGYAGGGGVYTIGNFEMSGGEIYDNYAVQGGGILSTSWASVSGSGITAAPASKINVTISGGRIYNNSSKLSGGAIFAAGTKLTLSGNGVIAENKSVEGNVGGVACIRYTDFTISGGEISGNSAAQNGGGVYASTESSITMTGGTISGNKATYMGGGVYVAQGASINMSEGKVINNSTTSSGSAGGGMFIDLAKSAIISGGEVSGNTTGLWGGGICAHGDLTISGGEFLNNVSGGYGGGISFGISNTDDTVIGTLTLTKGKIAGNSAAEYGGGLLISGTKLNMGVANENNVIISDNSSNYGGGIYIGIKENAVVNIISGTISGNTAGNGAGVYVDSTATFTMNGGTIDGNSAVYGGGVANRGTFTMSGGSISGNEAVSSGGVFVPTSGAFTMSGGEISGNTATKDGGGVYVQDSSTFTMSDGTISGNTATESGGAIYVRPNVANAEILGGTISNNFAGHRGGGIYLLISSIKLQNCTITNNEAGIAGGGVFGAHNLSGGKIIISDNTVNDKLSNIKCNEGVVVTVSGALNADSKIGLGSYSALPVTITSGYTSSGNTAANARNIFSADVEGVVAVYENNEIVLKQGVVLTVNNDKGEKIGSISTVSGSTVNGAFDEDKRIYTLTENGALANTSGFAFASDVVPEGYAAYMYVYGDVDKAEITSYTMGTENATVCLTTKALEKNYTINYYVQGNNGEYGTTPITATHSAATDSAVVVLDENGRPFATSITPADQYELDEAHSEWKSATVNGDGSTVVDVYLKLKEYTVSFTAPGATNGMQKKTFKYGAVISDEGLKVPSKDMNTFAGWYYDAACTEANKVNFGVDKVEGDITLYAKFTTKSYSLIFDLNLGDGEKQLNTSLVLSQDAADLAGNKVLWDTDSLFDASFKFGQTEGTGRYQISYDVNNVSSPKNLLGIRPSAIGYTFLGWFASETATSQTQTIRKPSANTADVITLTARWEPATYTMRFDKCNGSRIEIKEPANLAFWKDVLPTAPENAGYEFAGWYTTEAAAKDPEHNLDVFMSSSIYEEGNEEATAKFSIYDFGALYGDSASGYNFNNLTIYAGWKSVDVRIRVADSEETPMMGDLEFKTSAGSTISTTTAVHIGDEITVEAYADPGYRFISLTVGGRTSTGRIEEVRDENDPEKIKYWTTKFTVSGRDLIDDGRLYVEVGAVFTERRYTITYDTAGGRSTDSTFARTYSASELDENSLNRAKLPSLLTKRGYDFAGWVFSTNEDEVAYDTQDDITSSLYGAELWLKRPYDYAESGYRNITLKAVWKAQVSYVYLYNASYSAGYNYDEAGKRYIIRQYGADFEEPKDLTTDMEIEIVNPSRGESFVFLGWATSRNGVVVYPAVEGKDTITYTVNADKDENGNLLNRNNLYAVWHIAGVNYIIMSADNNGATYGDGEGITMSAQTARKYDATEAANITLNYTWYKIYDGQYDNCFDVKEYEDSQGYKIYVDDTDAIVAYEKDGKYYGADKTTEISKEQAEAYGSKLTYKEFNATKALAGGYCEVKKFIDPDTNREVVTTGLKPTDVLKVNVREVNDCGIYICVVEVVATGEGATSKTDGYGEIEITMNKAVYDGVDMTDTTVSYNTAPRYDMISIKDNSGNDPTTEDGGVRYLVLPDGSRLIVTYRYFVGEGEARKEITDLTQIKNVGTYHVEVSFEFTPDGDKGNYELPTTIDADLIVEPDSIGNMQYEFKHDGTLVTTDTTKFSGGYDGKEYKVEATILDTTGIGTDAPLVTTIDDIAFDVKVYRVSETGSETEVTGPTTEAGSYYIEIVGLKGADAGNYALGSGLTLRADYSIGKKTYEVAGHIKFDDDEVTFDNEIHTLNVKLDDGYTMPEDVNVVYKTSYVAEAEDFTVGRLPNEAKDFNGGRYAGEYTVTVTFEFKNDEAKNNYEALESMSATLKIKKANIFDFYNKDGKDLLRDGGFVNATYAYTVGKYYDPYIANGMFTETEHFEVEYEYYRVNENAEAGAGREMLASGTHAELAAQSNENALISLAGKYEIVARIKYVSALYRNNFEEITESESTITYVIRAVAVEKVEVIEWADGFDRVVKLGAGFDFGEGENYGWIKKILVTYAQDEQGQGGGTLEVVSPADIRLAGIKFEQKNNVDQTTFWKVGAFNVIVSFYGTESEAYVFTVKEKVASVELQYSTDDGATFRPVGENGVELVDGANYSFRIEYKCTNEQGVANTTKTSALTYDGALKLGSNKLTVSEAYYEFDEITVDMYKVIEGDVTWQYSTDGEHWDNIADGKLEYAGVEYKIRATFEDGGETQALEAHTALGVAVLNYTSGGYLMQVGRSGNYLVKAEYLLEITPLVLEVSWDKNELPYNTWHQSPVATAKNMKEKDIELITFDYEFEQGGATVTSANVVNVGDYVVKLVLRGDETARNNYTLIGSETAEHEFSIVQAEIEMTVTYSEHNYGPNVTYRGNNQGLRLNALKKDFGENAEVEGEFAFITNYSAATGKYDIIDGADLKDKISSVGYADIMYVYIPENKNYKDKIGTIEINVLGQTARSGAGALSVEFGEDAVQFYLVNQQFDTYGIEVYLLYQSAYEEDGEWYGMRDRIENPNFRIGSMVAQGYTITAQDLSSEKVVLRAISGSNSGTLDVKVVDKVAQGLEVSSTGHRTQYYIGETFDFSDMEFRVTFGPDDNPQDGLKKGSIKADFSGAFTEVGTKTVTFTYFNVSCTETFTVKAKEDLQIIQPTNLVLTYKNGEALEAPQLRFSVDGMTFGQTELDGVTVRVEVRDKATNEIAVLGAKKEGLYTVRYIFTVTNPRFNRPAAIDLEVRVTENPYQVDIDTASVDGQKVAYTGEYIAIPKAVVGSVTDTTTDTTVPSNYVIIEYTINGERVTSESQWTRTALNRGAYEVIVTVKVRRNGEADYTAATASYTFEVTQAVNDKGNASIEVHPVILGEGADFNFTVTADFGADTATFEYSRTGNANDWTSEVPTEAGTWFVRAKIAETENYQGIDEIIASFEVRIADKQADTSEEGSVEGSVSGSDGIGADWKLTIKESEIEDVNINKQTSLYGYTVSLVDKNGVAVETTGEYKVSIKLTAEQVEALSGRTDIRLFLYGADGTATAVEAEVKDGYIEFTTESFGKFVITSVIPDAPTVPVGLLVAVIIGAVAAAGMIAAVVVVAVKKRKGAQE